MVAEKSRIFWPATARKSGRFESGKRWADGKRLARRATALELLISVLLQEPIVALGVLAASERGSTTMWNSVFEEAREVAWLVSIIGGLSVAAVGLAVALVAA